MEECPFRNCVLKALPGNNKLITIIIPTLNEEDSLTQTLESLSAASGRFEMIVVDGQSTDSTRDIAARYCRTLTCPPHRAMQMNYGAEEAQGEAFLFLHADVLFPATGIRSLEAPLADPQIAGGNFDIQYEGPGMASRIFTAINRWRRPFGIFYGDSGIFVRREVFRALGGFRALPLMEDFDFARRLVKSGKTVCLEDSLLVSARRWEEHGLFRTMAAWSFLQPIFLLGVPAHILARYYLPIRRRPHAPETVFESAEVESKL